LWKGDYFSGPLISPCTEPPGNGADMRPEQLDDG
jgi:hypothetical protein